MILPSKQKALGFLIRGQSRLATSQSKVSRKDAKEKLLASLRLCARLFLHQASRSLAFFSLRTIWPVTGGFGMATMFCSLTLGGEFTGRGAGGAVGTRRGSCRNEVPVLGG